ncbi:MAG: glycosyltransferase family 4 protein [Christensenellales bacterium]
MATASTEPGKYHYIPIPANCLTEQPELGTKMPNILYVGDMLLNNNYLSIEWFAREVFEKIARRVPYATLSLVGRITKEHEYKMQSISSQIKVLGYVDSIDKEFQQAAFVICPVLYGAGVKVKTIDALARGQLVVGTSKAIEGTLLKPNVHVLVSDEASEYADICTEILMDRGRFSSIIIEGWKYVKAFHNVENQARLFSEVLCN